MAICVGKYALNAGTIGRPNALWKKAIKTIIHIDFISKKNNIGINASTKPCIIVAVDIIFVFENRSTIAPMKRPQKIAGKYEVIATIPVIFSELVSSKTSHMNATS